MRKNLFTICCTLLFISCGSGDDSSEPITENKAPLVPGLVAPANNLLCIDNTVVFEWNATSDPDSDAITYQIEVSKESQFKQIDFTNSVTAPAKSILLEKGTRYYWRVKAIDSQNLSGKYSEVFQFYTEGVGLTNHLPFVASLIKLELSSSLNTNSVVLEWNASDVDAADVLTYDVYFGTTNPPTVKVSSNQSLKNYTQSLNSSGTYYWSVDVKDQKGGISKGQVWRFVKN